MTCPISVEMEIIRMERAALRAGLPLAPSPTPQLEKQAGDGGTIRHCCAVAPAESSTERLANLSRQDLLYAKTLLTWCRAL